MRYAKVIDNRKCIGCHACTVACKAENEVPLGVNRTWVKVVEKGQFPSTRLHFQVSRCVQCEEPPCVEICPVTSMYQRADGIVDFDPEACIGCKACIAACPYDAIYMNPQNHAAGKCNFCAHRVDVGLEPACVTVCPTQAIIVGDMDDPQSQVSQLIARHDVRVRRPEKGTRPKMFYVEAEEAAIVPGAAQRQDAMMWAQMWAEELGYGKDFEEVVGSSKARVAYDVGHPKPWGWHVHSYLWTKSIGAGALLVPAVWLGLGQAFPGALFGWLASLLSLVFIGLTTLLLVLDLDRPRKFLTILTRPQWRSWLAIGGFILIAYTGVSGLWFLGSLLPGFAHWVMAVLPWPTALLAVLAASYSAFLFGQAKGRDFWQSPSLPVHLLVQAWIAGTSILLVGSLVLPAPGVVAEMLRLGLGAGLVVHLALVLLGEVYMPHMTAASAQAARMVRAGPFRNEFWWGAVVAGVVVPVALLLANLPLLSALAALLALAGLWIWERVWVVAGQSIPQS